MRLTSWFAVTTPFLLASPHVLAQCNGRWVVPLNPGGIGYPNASISAMTTWDPDGQGPLPERLVIAAGPVQAYRVYAWDGHTWTTLGGVFNSPESNNAIIRELGVHNNQLYAGGMFTRVDSTRVNHVCQWDGTAWRSMRGGVSIPNYGGESVQVLSFQSFDGDLWVGGVFGRADNVSSQGVCRWNGQNWAPVNIEVPNWGFDGAPVFSMTQFRGELYFGGGGGLHRYDGAVARRFDSNGGASHMVSTPTGVYQIGVSTRIGDATISNGIARWDGVAWQDFLHPFVAPNPAFPFGAYVSTAVNYHDKLTIIGNFTTDDFTPHRIVTWDGGTWCSLSERPRSPRIPWIAAEYQGCLRILGFTDTDFTIAQWTDACDADLDDGTASGQPNGGVDINDLIFFLDRFEAGHLIADLDDASATGNPDLAVTIDDLIYFLRRFELGC